MSFPFLAVALCACLATVAMTTYGAAVVVPAGKAERAEARSSPRLDRSGKARQGEASYYGKHLHGKKMADGTPLDLQSSAAASKTLPLGTRARVKNLENGRSAVVEIRDRGPHVKGRIIDLTPRTARQLGLKEDGVARVEVAPIEVPMEDGSTRPGEGARKR